MGPLRFLAWLLGLAGPPDQARAIEESLRRALEEEPGLGAPHGNRHASQDSCRGPGPPEGRSEPRSSL